MLTLNSHLDGRVSWLEQLYFDDSEKLKAHNFRVFVQANDGKWYKQQNPLLWELGRFGVLCQFGEFSHEYIGRTYRVVCLRSPGLLPNVYEAGKAPIQGLGLSQVYEFRRAS